MQDKKRIRVRLNEKEKAQLDRQVKESGLSRAAYMRLLISKIDMTEPPEIDYQTMALRLNEVGAKFNLVARKAHMLNEIDTELYNEAYEEYLEIVAEIREAVK